MSYFVRLVRMFILNQASFTSFMVKNHEDRIVACGMNCDAFCVPETKPKAKRLSYVFEVLEHVKGPARYRAQFFVQLSLRGTIAMRSDLCGDGKGDELGGKT